MKVILPLIVVGAVLCVVLFVAGVVSPGRSRRWQSVTGRWFRKGEGKGDESGGRFGDLTRDALGLTRRATEASAQGGRDLHDKLPRANTSPSRPADTTGDERVP